MTTTRRQILGATGAAALLAKLGAIRSGAWATAPSAEGLSMESMAAAYSLDPSVTYLNHASIGTVPRVVQAAHERYLELCETNPWLYVWWEPWTEPREAVRERAATLLGCTAGELAIVHNTTEVFNVLAQGLPIGAGDEVLFSSLNHAGASVCWSHHGAERGYSVRQFDLPLADVPGLTLDQVVELHVREIRPETKVLVLPHVDNMVGLRHPVAAIGKAARAAGVEWIAVDGAQSAGMLDLDVRAMEVDVFATSGHKWLQSPKGLGLLYVRERLLETLRPMWVTWGQERWAGAARIFEDYGTRAVPAVLALGDALDFQAEVGSARRETAYRTLREQLWQRVEADDRLIWRSPREWTLGASLVAVEVRDQPSYAVAQEAFARHGLVVRPFEQPDFNALRVSPNVANSAADLDRFVESVLT